MVVEVDDCVMTVSICADAVPGKATNAATTASSGEQRLPQAPNVPSPLGLLARGKPLTFRRTYGNRPLSLRSTRLAANESPTAAGASLFDR